MRRSSATALPDHLAPADPYSMQSYEKFQQLMRLTELHANQDQLINEILLFGVRNCASTCGDGEESAELGDQRDPK